MNTEQLLELRDNLRKSIETIDAELINLDWRHWVNRGEMILAIKSYRHTHIVRLKEAKDVVDAFRELIKS